MKTATLNYFAPDPETTLFSPHPTNAPEDESRLRTQLAGWMKDLEFTIVSVTPSHQGSFDVTLRGPEDVILRIADEIGILYSDIDWAN